MNKVQHLGNKLTKLKVKRNILRVWNATSLHDRHDWYIDVHTFCKSLVTEQICIHKTAGIVAALSPLKQWNENKRIAKLFIQGVRISLHTSGQMHKAQQILESDGSEASILAILNGEKTKSFYINLVHPDRNINVTIDRHALSIAVGKKLTDKDMAISKNQYAFFVSCYVSLANDLNIRPSLLQSATWNLWRNKNQITLF